MEKVTGTDIATSEFFNWIYANCSQREKDFIFLAHRYTDAYLTKRAIESNQEVSEYDLSILVKVQELIGKYGCPALEKREPKHIYDLMLDTTK